MEIFEDNRQKSFKPGDVVVTMESDQFPSGFLVGRILPFQPSSKYSFHDISVQPFVDFDSLEDVFVVLKVKDTEEKNESIN